MAIITPTITAENYHQYREQIERVEAFAKQIHIDLMDGVFTPNKSVEPEHLWLPEYITCDIHVMFQKPEQVLELIKIMKVRLFIVPAESDCDFQKLAEDLGRNNIKFGVALLADTSVQSAKDIIALADHTLIFSGNLGHQGGSNADMNLLNKVAEIKAINPDIEIGWDGGVNEHNVKQIADAGVDIINVGGAIHFAQNPAESYAQLQDLI